MEVTAVHGTLGGALVCGFVGADLSDDVGGVFRSALLGLVVLQDHEVLVVQGHRRIETEWL